MKANKINQRIFVADGFAEVNEQGCIVLSSEAYPVDDLDRAEVQERLKAAQDDLADADSDAERDKAEAEIAICEAMLVAIG